MTQPGTAGYVGAPSAPGRLGETAPTARLSDYLDALAAWTGTRRGELDAVDEAALRSGSSDYTDDVMLAMALFQSVCDRQQEMRQVWDNGRLDAAGRERLTRLAHARLDTPGALGLSPAETCRLCDALIAQLRSRMAFDPLAADAAVRVARVREGLTRLAALTAREPSYTAQVATLTARLDDLAVRARRGADIAAALTDVEGVAATVERDLIVLTATRREEGRRRRRDEERLAADRARAAALLETLAQRRRQALDLADTCVREVLCAPRLAVPDPAALGPVPTDPAALAAHLARLDAVARGFDQVEHTYQGALDRLGQVLGRWEAYRLTTGRASAGSPDLAAAVRRATDAAARRPCDVDDLAAAVDAVVHLMGAKAPDGTARNGAAATTDQRKGEPA